MTGLLGSPLRPLFSTSNTEDKRNSLDSTEDRVATTWLVGVRFCFENQGNQNGFIVTNWTELKVTSSWRTTQKDYSIEKLFFFGCIV